MITLVDSTRRGFLKVGVAAGLNMAGLARAGVSPTKQKAVVFLYLSGGATHIETFDPKPNAPEEFRSVSGAIKTNVVGLEFGGDWRRLSQHADKLAVVRSFAHRNAGHAGGTHWVVTGYDNQQVDNGGSQARPGFGSILSRHRGATGHTGLPTYVRTDSILGDGASFLGSSYAPFSVNGEAARNLNLTVPAERIMDRRLLAKTFDQFQNEFDRSGLAASMDDFERQTFLLLNGQSKRAFDVTQEPEHVRSSYGRTGIGDRLLLARRLVEAGTGFVTVSSGAGWDHHSNIKDEMGRAVPAVDKAVAAFLSDLSQRGLSNDVLLVVTGEFGRTPRINNNAGRDHYPTLSTLMLAGGGLKRGVVVGESTSRAEAPKTRPITPQDLMSTIFHVLGMPQNLTYHDQSGRPIPMVNNGSPIVELI